MRFLLALLLLFALPASAEEQIVSPSEFREYAEGWTLYFDRDGQPFGSEEFYDEGRVKWRYRDGSCIDGVWRTHGAQLCFLFDTSNSDGQVQCWRVLRKDEDLYVRLLNDTPDVFELRVSGRDKRPLLCGAPATNTGLR
jgi:hypothetical protein